MSGTSTDDPEKPMEQPKNDLSEAMRQLSVTSNDISTPPKNLSDMPVDVVALITEKLVYKEQLILRKVSKSLRSLVDKLKPACKSMRFDCGADDVHIVLNNHIVVYTDHVEYYLPDDNYTLNIVIRDDFRKITFDELASTLKNPKLQLESFMISDNFSEKKDIDEYYNNIQRVFESINHQVSIKEIEFKGASPSYLLSILPYLRPGFLEKISLSFHFSGIDQDSRSTGMDKVALLEQWKQAKTMELFNPFDSFPMEYATHFKRFQFKDYRITGEKLIRIRDYLSKLDDFEQCTQPLYKFFIDPEPVYQVLGTPVTSNATGEIYHHHIPDSNYYLEFKIPTNSSIIETEKKKREIH